MNKLAIVTGASSGIGQATARRLAKLGYNLVITARRKERLEELAEELISTYGIKIQILSFDVRDREATEQALSTIDKSLGDICVLMNNAGLAAGLEHIDQGSTDDWDRMIDTNVKGVLYVTRIVSTPSVWPPRPSWPAWPSSWPATTPASSTVLSSP